MDAANNSPIVFGATTWMRLPHFRERIHDGLIDQIEVYDTALTDAAIAARYDAFVPEPSTLVIATAGIVGAATRPRRREVRPIRSR